MASVGVDIYVSDESLTPLPLEGVVVGVFDAAGANLLATGTTDVDGLAAFLLDDGTTGLTYSVRTYRAGVSFSNPKAILVLPSPATNRFDLYGAVKVIPSSLDPRVCVAYGWFVTGSKQPDRSVEMQFITKRAPLLVDSLGVFRERVTVSSDKNGYIEIPLIRCAEYDVTVTGFEDLSRIVYVPDAPNILLPDLLLPVVKEISWDPSGPYSVVSGSSLSLTPTVQATDLQILEGTAIGEVRWSSSDETILVVEAGATTITLRGIAPGTAELRAERISTEIQRLPDTPIVGAPLTVTVT